MKFALIVSAIILSICSFGCGRKQAATEEAQEPMTMEELSTTNAPVQPVTVTVPVTSELPSGQAAQVSVSSEANLGPLPPSGPYKPTSMEIQSALKNAGFYVGEIDGKIGPKSKKAIEEFQKANNLQADGKVGLKTWAALGKYLNPAPEPVKATVPAAKKKR